MGLAAFGYAQHLKLLLGNLYIGLKVTVLNSFTLISVNSTTEGCRRRRNERRDSRTGSEIWQKHRKE